jgi:hypothetical protein
MKEEPQKLDLEKLCVGLSPGLSARAGAMMAEAAGVCLDDQGHAPGCLLTVEGCCECNLTLSFCSVDATRRATWNDQEEATEQGAYGVALLLLHEIEGQTVITRSRKGTGFDYWVGKEDGALFQQKARLEVSGIRHGGSANIEQRVRQKTRQAGPGRGGIQTYVAIVEYSAPLARVVQP